MSSSAGMMTFPTEWKNQSHVPNHQPVVGRATRAASRRLLGTAGARPCAAPGAPRTRRSLPRRAVTKPRGKRGDLTVISREI